MPDLATRWQIIHTYRHTKIDQHLKYTDEKISNWSNCMFLPALTHDALWAAVCAHGAVCRLGHAVAAARPLALPGPGHPGHRVVVPVVRRQARPGVLGIFRARPWVKVRVGGHRCTDSHRRKWRDTISGGPGRDRIGSVMCSRLENGREWC